MELDARFQSIEDSLAEARRALADLADRSLVEQVLRQEYEYEKASQSHSRRSSAVPEENDTIRICHDCVSRNDIGTAFLTILRYIDSFANSKADSSELPERATREYVETRFGQLESVVRRQLTTSYKMLQRTVEGQLQKLMSDFSAFEEAVGARMKFTEDDIDRIEAGITARVARGSGQEKLPVREKRLKFRSDGIAEPVRIEEKEEPSARMLMPAVLRRSMDRSEVRSLIPGTRVGKRRT